MTLSHERRPSRDILSADGGERRMVCIDHISGDGTLSAIKDDFGHVHILSSRYLLPLPEPMTAEARAVLETSLLKRQHYTQNPHGLGNKVISAWCDAVDAYRASIAPTPKVDPVVEELIAAGNVLRQAQMAERVRFGRMCIAENTNANDLEHAKYEHECACKSRVSADARWNAAVAAARAKGAAP